MDLATASKADRRCFPVVLHLFAQQLVDVSKNTAVLQLPGRIIDSNVITALNSRNICAMPESRSVDDETHWEITRGNGSKEATRQQIKITGKTPWESGPDASRPPFPPANTGILTEGLRLGVMDPPIKEGGGQIEEVHGLNPPPQVPHKALRCPKIWIRDEDALMQRFPTPKASFWEELAFSTPQR